MIYNWKKLRGQERYSLQFYAMGIELIVHKESLLYPDNWVLKVNNGIDLNLEVPSGSPITIAQKVAQNKFTDLAKKVTGYLKFGKGKRNLIIEK